MCDYKNQEQEPGKSIAGAYYQPPTLLKRLEKAMSHAQQEQMKFEKMARLEHLIRKNPEVAEMLDLLEQIGRL